MTGRRKALKLLSALPALWLLPARAALPPTPEQMLGPYYPLQPDPAAGNDLTTRDGRQRAAGIPLAIVGRVVDTAERPLAGVLVEIWQTNTHGRYHHPHDTSPQALDPHFRGYGRATTDADGRYRFRTIVPTAYPGRTPHVHFRLSRGEHELLVTQMYLPGHLANERDGLYMSLPRQEDRLRLIGIPDAADTLRFDIVIATPR